MNQRQINAMHTKEKIYKVALKLFIEHGFENVSINDITQQVGMAKGTFYTHFKSKDQIIVDHYRKIDDHYEDTFQVLTNIESNYERVMLILKEGFLYTEKIGKELLRVVLISQISGKEDIPFVMDSRRKIYKILLELVRNGQQNGEFSLEHEANKIVVSILQHYSGVYMRWCLLDEEDSLTEIGMDSIRLLFDSFRK
ncbi:TetR/AcrR family transcriptional regulator [Neobacillus sp. MM2021_6]|uniref:TetR/AcrR family transcriptional regulator n=1 Tax=Bacillaceae TaxID=186817 RepID=UPI00140CDF5B|nr:MULTISPECIES: TetR/AcrR family transcriptional regulator [Bacillaceae]MBO0959930.1 TetR/AcrR family transcriptional regulator [Neobacillus sp. MM2021_6]NHC18879.1 TetR/AcrR family transcriptional regulator [Bacillus sp. MM2020_4]